MLSEAVVAGDGHAHVDRGGNVEDVLENKEDDCANIHPLLAVVAATLVVLGTLKRRFPVKCPEGAEDDYDDVDGQYHIEQHLHVKHTAANHTSMALVYCLLYRELRMQ